MRKRWEGEEGGGSERERGREKSTYQIALLRSSEIFGHVSEAVEERVHTKTSLYGVYVLWVENEWMNQWVSE